MAHIAQLSDLPIGLRNAHTWAQLQAAGVDPSRSDLATLSPFEMADLCTRAQTKPALVKAHLVAFVHEAIRALTPRSAAEQRAMAEGDATELSIRRPRHMKDILAAVHPALAEDVVVRFLVEAVGMPASANEVRCDVASACAARGTLSATACDRSL